LQRCSRLEQFFQTRRKYFYFQNALGYVHVKYCD
jgi:hypothetical protein